MNIPLKTLTLAATLSCGMATSWASQFTQASTQQQNDYDMFMEKYGRLPYKTHLSTKRWHYTRKMVLSATSTTKMRK